MLDATLLSESPGGGRVFRAKTRDGHVIELVDSTPPAERSRRRVFGISTLLGCPVRCSICDAGGGYMGRLTAEEMLAELDFLVHDAFPEGVSGVEELCIELTRMGEPSFNADVLEVLAALPGRYGPVRVVPTLSSVGPARCEWFFEKLLEVKAKAYPPGDFVMQLSLHTTDEAQRKQVVPVKCLPYAWLAAWGRRFVGPKDRKVVLAFPATSALPVEPAALARTFPPDVFAVKLTRLNPSEAALQHGLSGLPSAEALEALATAFRAQGYDVELAGPELLEDPTGCGRYYSMGQSPEFPRRTHVRG